MIVAVTVAYDSIDSFILQPVIAVLCSAFFVAVALLVGLAFRIPSLSRWWHTTSLWAGVLVVASLFVFCYGWELGITETVIDPETGRKFTQLHPAAAAAGYFALIFSLANWPLRKGPSVEPSTAPNGGPAEPLGDSGVAGGPPLVS